MMKTDIEIAQECMMEPITKVAEKAGIPEERIYYFGKDDNWWIAGETGPCGPDTEMFYDTGKPKCSPECNPSCGCGKYVEIWNNVFMEFYKDENGKYSKLKQHNVDTGLGLERMTMLLQGKETPFETELFAPIMDKLVELQKVDNIASRRIVAEHLRSSMMIICDGGRPSNVDRGYVLRRLIRRMVRHMNKLQISLDELSTLIDINVENLKEMYPALEANKETIKNVILEEKDKFVKTLEKGEKEFAKEVGQVKEQGENIVPGKVVFRLYDTYGFPPEVTEELATENGMKIDKEGFDKLFKEHQEKSRAGSEQKFKGGLASTGEMETKYHTATHLLNAALKQVLGSHVHQRGSNITAERMRFDFSHPAKMTDEEKQKTELHEKYGILVDALEAAGYRYDYRESEPGHIVLAPDGTHEIAGYLQFESWGDIKDWLEDTIAEGTDISERVDRALYPFKFDYTLEEEMFRGNGDRYAIYHVDEGTPGKQHLFMNMAMVKEDGITIDAANYKCVYSGRLHENEKLDDLYAVFNDNPPADYKAHSMSVSDVIITNRGGDMQAYYVDRFGFVELPDFAAQREKILDIVPEIENVDYENDLTCISFYAAECAEFPVMGEVHYDLTLPEALEAYEKIPSERMHGLKCVGFDLKDGSDYEGMQSLMIEGKIQKEFLNSIPGFRENSYVQNAISRVEKYLEERHPNVENPLKSNKKVDNEKNISEEKNEKELNIQMKPIPKKKRGEMSL